MPGRLLAFPRIRRIILHVEFRLPVLIRAFFQDEPLVRHSNWVHTFEMRIAPKTEIEIGWEAQKGLVGRAGRGYNRCGTNHNY
jgi:hypothetical protein